MENEVNYLIDAEWLDPTRMALMISMVECFGKLNHND